MTWTVYSDSGGRFTWADLPEGVYDLRAWSPDLGDAQMQEIALEGGSTDLDFRLPPGRGRWVPPSSAVLSALPDGERKRRFTVDCTGCHQFGPLFARKDGRVRTEEEWREAIRRMTDMAGPGTSFPIISRWVDPAREAAWLFAALESGVDVPPELGRPDPSVAGTVVLTEYDYPAPFGLPHDLAVDGDGRIVITGMFTHVMLILNPETGVMEQVEIPEANANPRAVEIGPDGRWWVLLGAPQKIAGFDPASQSWQFYDIGMYPHSIMLDEGGRVWFNGHFSWSPEYLGVLAPETGDVRRIEVSHDPSLWAEDESTIPYGLRVASDGTVWATQLRGNGLIRHDPATGGVRTYAMPTPHSGPRRLDLGPDGIVWIPEYGGNKLARFDPVVEEFTEFDFPVPDALPYVVRVDQTRGTVWIATSAADLVVAFDPESETFTRYDLPTRGALIRHIDVDERTGDLWAAYGASPGIAPRILRIRTR